METWAVILLVVLAFLIIVGIVLFFAIRSIPKTITTPATATPPPFAPITPPFTPIVPPPTPPPTPPTLAGQMTVNVVNDTTMSLTANFSTPTSAIFSRISKDGEVVSPTTIVSATPTTGVSAWRINYTLPSGYLEDGQTYLLKVRGTNNNVTGPIFMQYYIYKEDPVGPEVEDVTFSSSPIIKVQVSFDSPADSMTATLSRDGTTINSLPAFGGGKLWSADFTGHLQLDATYTLTIQGSYRGQAGPVHTSRYTIWSD